MNEYDRRAASTAQGHERSSLTLMARLRRRGERGSIEARVRNLSAGGLMAETARPIDPDAAIEIELDGLGWVSGRVAWHAAGRTGIAFDQPIDPQRVRRSEGEAGAPEAV